MLNEQQKRKLRATARMIMTSRGPTEMAQGQYCRFKKLGIDVPEADVVFRIISAFFIEKREALASLSEDDLGTYQYLETALLILAGLSITKELM